MNSKFLKVVACAACVFAFVSCGDDKDEPQVERKITVTAYESAAPKGNEFYNPKEWSYTSTMLFDCQPSAIDKAATTATLANNAVTLASGETIKAKYASSTGVIYDAAFGSYTLVVYCTGNPFNAYLEHRWTCQQFNYTANNCVADLNCCFVWEDMQTGGGYTQWAAK